VVEEWRNRVKKMQKCVPVEICSQQVKECIKIGLRCVETDPEKRPAASDIITTLNATKNEDKSSGVDKGPRVEEVIIQEATFIRLPCLVVHNACIITGDTS